MKDWLLLGLRLAAGIGLAFWAGHDKVFDPNARQAYVELLQSSGVAAAPLLAILFGIIEFFGALFFAAGFFSRPVTIILLLAGMVSSAIQLLAMDLPTKALFQYDQSLGIGTGYYLFAFLLVLILGPGKISFDAGRKSQSDN